VIEVAAMAPETVRFFAVQTALLAVVLVLHTYIGLHIIRRTLIFSDLVLDQLAAFGALVGIALGIEYGTFQSYFASLAAVLLGATLLALIKPSSRTIPREAVIGIMYAMALVACLLLGDKLASGEAYVTKTLAGSMLWVTWPLVAVTTVVYVLLLLFHYKFRHKFIGLAENHAGTPNERFWDFLLFTTQGIITVLIVPIAGVLLAYAFLMIPAAIAAMFTAKWAGAVIIGWAVGFVACLIGLCSSYFFDLPYGPSLVLSLGIFFISAIVIRCFSSAGQPAS
jgi:zinc/manganese transport system permease protein